MTSSPLRPIPTAMRPLRSVVHAGRRLLLQMFLRRRLQIGKNVKFGRRAHLAPPLLAQFGNNIGIGADFHLEADLEVGDDVLISSRVAIVARDHVIDVPGVSVYFAGRRPAGRVVLEGDNLIGFGTIIIAPARLGRGCIVGAGAVVTGDLPPNTVCAGIPARPIKLRLPAQRGS